MQPESYDAVIGVTAMHKRQFTAIYRKSGKWWAAYVEELPGANTQGKTIEEARENLKEAISLMLEYNREKAAE